MTLAHRLIFCSIIVVTSSASLAEPLNLCGKVVDENGHAISNAMVDVHTAKPRTGTIPYCPSCYLDCRKQVTSDPEGRFSITNLDPKLLFKLLVVAEDYNPQFIRDVDPNKSPYVIALRRIPTERLSQDRVIKGKITDTAGNPIAGATISPFAIETKPVAEDADSEDDIPFDIAIDEQGNWDFNPRPRRHRVLMPRPRPIRSNEVDPLAIANEEGEFYLTSQSPDLTVYVTIHAPGFAALPSCKLSSGSQTHQINLNRGATIKGRLTHKGWPVTGAILGVIQRDRGISSGFLGEYTTTTNPDGSFYIFNLPPDVEYYIYGKMESLQEKGSLPEKQFKTGGHGSEQNLGVLSLQQSYHMRGRVLLRDGKPIPEETHLLFSREEAWDSQIIKINDNGSFSAKGLPADAMSIHVSVPGYRLSKNNSSLDPVSGRYLLGKVMEDCDNFSIELEQGEAIQIDRNRQSREAQKQKQKTPFRSAENQSI